MMLLDEMQAHITYHLKEQLVFAYPQPLIPEDYKYYRHDNLTRKFKRNYHRRLAAKYMVKYYLRVLELSTSGVNQHDIIKEAAK